MNSDSSGPKTLNTSATVVDIQHHYVPRSLAEKSGWKPGEQYQVSRNGQPVVTLHDRVVDLDWQLSDMDSVGIDQAVLSCLVGWDTSADACRTINDDLAVQRDRYSNRFDGFASLPMEDEKATLMELDRSVNELGLPGVTVMSQINGRFLDDPSLHNIWASVEKLNVPVFVHPIMHAAKSHYGSGDYDLGRIIAREFDLATAVTRVIASGLLDRFPGLTFIFGHFGGGIAAIKERVRNKAFRFGTGLKEDFDSYFDRLYFDMAGFEGGSAALHAALLGIEPRQMIFATDYPQDFTGVMTATGVDYKGIATYIDAIRELEISEDEKQGMLGGNWTSLAAKAAI